jgi:hypothetical protein
MSMQRPANDFYPANQANRRNAARSTGPTTEAGKHRSRRNAVRHGLCAETVVEIVEDIYDFEGAVIADYDAALPSRVNSCFRLASLLWRLRRATMIETDLLRIKAELLRDRRNRRLPDWSSEMPSPILGLTTHRVPDTEKAKHPSCSAQADRDPALAYPAGHPIRQPKSCIDASLPSAGRSRQRSV